MTHPLSNSRHQKMHYPLVVISDTHLGKKFSQADMLLEFLQSVDCDTLIMNGDIIDGWALSKKKQKAFPEMHRRVLDAINDKIENGTKVIYIAGNHDMTLRNSSVMGRDGGFRGIHFEEALEYHDPQGRKWFFLHGDQYDPNMLKKKGKVLYHFGDNLYDGFIAMSVSTSKMAHKLLKTRFSAAAYIKKHTKKFIQLISNFEDAVMNSAVKNDADGIICGHIHTAEWREIDLSGNKRSQKTLYYGNSGDWVESCTALVQDTKGEWDVLHWLDLREELGFDRPPVERDPNPYSEQRHKTNRLLLWVNRLWGGKDKEEKIAEFMKARQKIQKLEQKDSLSPKKQEKYDKAQETLQKLRPVLWPSKQPGI